MAATIKIKNSSTAGAAPTSSDLVQGELAVNVTDKRLFTENSGGTVVELGTNPSSITLPDGSASAPTLLHSGDTNTGLFFPAADTIALTTGGSERLRLDSSGNLGLGVTPSAWGGLTKNIEGGSGSLNFYSTTQLWLTQNAYWDGAWKYKANGYATSYQQYTGGHQWFTSASGTAGNSISFTQAMTLDASGNLLLGQTSPTSDGQLSITTTGSNNSVITTPWADTKYLTKMYFSSSYFLGMMGNATGRELRLVSNSGDANAKITFYTGASGTASEVARIDSSGNLLVGTTSASNSSHTIQKNAAENVAVMTFDNWGSFHNCSAYGANAAASATKINKNSSTNRSINAGGTINASGADYAEYMTKAGDFTVAKGAVIGINAEGKLTNVFADAVSFAVKSTDPSYVGNDKWGVELEGDELEVARQSVDRIAFAGQVPVNVTGATAGQYIIPVNDNGSIKGQAVSNPTFEQYQIAVGKVIAIEQDGRAKIIVKVA